MNILILALQTFGLSVAVHAVPLTHLRFPQRSHITSVPTATTHEDKQLWNTFRATYLETAHPVSDSPRQKYGKRARGRPVWFMDQWERKAEELSQGKNGEFIAFVD
jgi:hypothetical protein